MFVIKLDKIILDSLEQNKFGFMLEVNPRCTIMNDSIFAMLHG